MVTVLIYVMIGALVVGAIYAGLGPKRREQQEMRKIICTNANCGYKGEPSREKQRSMIIFLFLFCLWILPGIVYYLMVPEYKYWCPECQTALKF